MKQLFKCSQSSLALIKRFDAADVDVASPGEDDVHEGEVGWSSECPEVVPANNVGLNVLW